MLVVFQGCGRRRQRQAVHVEGLAHAVQQLRDVGAGNAIADAQARQSVSLGKRARYDEVRVPGQPGNTVRVVGLVHVLGVGLIDHDDDPVGHRGEKTLERPGIVPGAGGIVGIGDEHQPRAFGDRVGHGRQIVPPVPRRHLHSTGAHGTGDQRINGECVLGEHHLVLAGNEQPGDQLQDVVGTVAQGQAVARHCVDPGQRGPQVGTAAIGVARQLVEPHQRHGPRLRAGTQGTLVGRQLDDVGEPQLALQLLDGFARLVRCQPGHTLIDQRKGITAHCAADGSQRG